MQGEIYFSCHAVHAKNLIEAIEHIHIRYTTKLQEFSREFLFDDSH